MAVKSKQNDLTVIEPQPGYQIKMLSSPADIVIGGGAAGLGKTYSLLVEFLRHINNPDWGGVIFRRTSPQIRNEGGLWDTSTKLYPGAGAKPKEATLEWIFPKGSKLKFSHLEHEKNILDWQGAQIPYIGFDELTHFSEKMFFYLLSRNRSTCGVNPYVRATCNPDPDSWVAKLIEWWIDIDTGYPIPERNGVVRYFTRDGENYIWGNSVEEVISQAWYYLEKITIDSAIDPKEFIKSITFVSGTIYENPKLLNVNPGYLANLLALPEQEKIQLLGGNWKTVVNDNDIYPYHAFIGCFSNLYSVKTDQFYITADIALEGSDKFVVGVWNGFELIDILIMDKSNGKEIIDSITGLAMNYRVANNKTTFDNDGVGGFIGGFIEQSVSFVNNSAALNKENYKNLKTQCYYKSGDRVSKGGYIISPYVAAKMYDDKKTVRQQFLFERKAIKKEKKDMDGKLQIIKKDAMKVYLGGKSPDLMDMFMMREVFELVPQMSWVAF